MTYKVIVKEPMDLEIEMNRLEKEGYVYVDGFYTGKGAYIEDGNHIPIVIMHKE